MEYCSENLEAILYAGGDLPQSLGDIVSSKVRLLNQFGASEIGLTTNLLSTNRKSEDWKYIQFHPDLGIELRHVNDDVYELYVIHDPKKAEQQPTFTIFPDSQEYASRDLFSHHPSKDKQDLWTWRARADDVMVFLNGEKTNPISMEQTIVSRIPEITAALVVGAQRFEAALLIEPSTDRTELTAAERAAFIEYIWPTIEQSNKECPSHARIVKSHILFTHPTRPMLRAGKGTVQRSGTLQLYADDIDALYSDAETMTRDMEEENRSIITSLDHTEVSQFVRRTMSTITSQPEIHKDDNFFTLGLDSLQTLTVVRKLKQGLAISNIAPSTVYTNPSVSALTDALLRISGQQQTSRDFEEQERSRERISVLNEYQNVINHMPASSKAPKNTHGDVIVLTGSTGALGSYVLQSLLTRSTTHVYCLNRASYSLSLQIERNRARGLTTQPDANRVTFLTADLSQSDLGLSAETYQKLLATSTHIIHNAWPVNFNLPLSAFRPQLDGLVNLVNFAATSAISPHLFFVSSISSVMSYLSPPTLKTSEEVILADSAPGSTGYAQSKYLSECLLDHAAQKLSIHTSFARVVQIAGAVNHPGLWNKAEWFPSLVISSLHVGAFPDSLGPSLGKIDWVPIDLLAEVLVDLALSTRDQYSEETESSILSTHRKMQPRRASVFHPLNPHPSTWEAVRSALTWELSISSVTKNNQPLKAITLSSWLAKVRKDIESTAGSHNALKDEEDLAAYLRANPAVKLLSFYEEALSGDKDSNELDIQETLRRSAKLRALESIKPEWIHKWVREWLASMV